MTSLLANIFGIESWLIIFALILVLFGGKKIPELMRGMGRGVGELQKGLEEGKRALQNSLHEDPAPAAAVAVTEPAASTTTNPPAAK